MELNYMANEFDGSFMKFLLSGNMPQDLQMQSLLLHYGPTPCGPGSCPRPEAFLLDIQSGTAERQGPLITPAPVADDLPVWSSEKNQHVSMSHLA